MKPQAESGGEPATPGAPAPARRLESLDAFRGLTVLGMLLVNNTAAGDATPATLIHAPWNRGITFADLVFPWFLFIVGVAIPFGARHATLGGILRRSAALVVLGWLVDSSVARTPVLGLGVLQLIGLAWAVGALLARVPTHFRLLLAAGLLVLHWAALRFIPIPGVGAGFFEEQRNFVSWLNQQYLASWHLQGLLSVVPTTALVLLGSCVGDLLRDRSRSEKARCLWLLGAGALAVGCGWLWNLDLPFNKAVWSASYILAGAGSGCLALGALYVVVDRWDMLSVTFPLRVMGKNALAAYVGPILLKAQVLQQWTWPSQSGPDLVLQEAFLTWSRGRWGAVAGGWVWTFGYMAVCWVAIWWMNRRGIYWRV